MHLQETTPAHSRTFSTIVTWGLRLRTDGDNTNGAAGVYKTRYNIYIYIYIYIIHIHIHVHISIYIYREREWERGRDEYIDTWGQHERGRRLGQLVLLQRALEALRVVAVVEVLAPDLHPDAFLFMLRHRSLLQKEHAPCRNVPLLVQLWKMTRKLREVVSGKRPVESS